MPSDTAGLASRRVAERLAADAQRAGRDTRRDHCRRARRRVEHREFADAGTDAFDAHETIIASVALEHRHLTGEQDERLVAEVAFPAERFTLVEPNLRARLREPMKSSGSSASNSLTEQSAMTFSSVNSLIAGLVSCAPPSRSRPSRAQQVMRPVGEELTVCFEWPGPDELQDAQRCGARYGAAQLRSQGCRRVCAPLAAR